MLDRPEGQSLNDEIAAEIAPQNLHQGAKEHLKAFIERIERLEEEKTATANDIAEVYKEAKGNGFDAKAIRKIIAIRKKADHERLEEEALLATYMQALGMLPDLASSPRPLAVSAGRGPDRAGHDADSPRMFADQAADADAARLAGYTAATQDGVITDNPYLHEDPRHGAWAEGFTSAAVSLSRDGALQ